MHIDMPEQLQAFLKQQVKSGLYSNESEVVRDAVRRMKEEKIRQDEASVELMAELAKGLRQAEAGQLIPFNEELLEEIKKRAMVNLKNKIPVKNIVKPKK